MGLMDIVDDVPAPEGWKRNLTVHPNLQVPGIVVDQLSYATLNRAHGTYEVQVILVASGNDVIKGVKKVREGFDEFEQLIRTQAVFTIANVFGPYPYDSFVALDVTLRATR